MFGPRPITWLEHHPPGSLNPPRSPPLAPIQDPQVEPKAFSPKNTARAARNSIDSDSSFWKKIGSFLRCTQLSEPAELIQAYSCLRVLLSCTNWRSCLFAVDTSVSFVKFSKHWSLKLPNNIDVPPKSVCVHFKPAAPNFIFLREYALAECACKIRANRSKSKHHRSLGGCWALCNSEGGFVYHSTSRILGVLTYSSRTLWAVDPDKCWKGRYPKGNGKL